METLPKFADPTITIVYAGSALLCVTASVLTLDPVLILSLLMPALFYLFKIPLAQGAVAAVLSLTKVSKQLDILNHGDKKYVALVASAVKHFFGMMLIFTIALETLTQIKTGLKPARFFNETTIVPCSLMLALVPMIENGKLADISAIVRRSWTLVYKVVNDASRTAVSLVDKLVKVTGLDWTAAGSIVAALGAIAIVLVYVFMARSRLDSREMLRAEA